MSTGKIQAVVFDVDGTLVDAFGDIAEATNAGLRALGLPEKSREEITKSVGYGSLRLVAMVMNLPEDSPKVKECRRVFVAHYKEHAGEHAFLYPGARNLLSFLREKGIRTAALTNKPHVLTVKTFEALEADNLLDLIQGETEGFPLKPDPAGLLTICSRLDVRPEHTIMVGDGDTDMDAASAAGAIPWGVTYGMRTAKELKAHGAKAVFDSLPELKKAIERLHQ
jgi:phosphoglycolate phosphatase